MADETTPSAELLRSPLHDRHAALGAKFAEFGGWSMPLEYSSGVVKEHTAVRDAVGIFDVSHLGKVMVTGPGAASYVNATLSNDLAKIVPGKAQYTLCCDPVTGGVVDDLIAYYHDDEHVLLVPNAANSAEVCRRLIAEAPEGVKVLDHHTQYVVLFFECHVVKGEARPDPGPQGDTDYRGLPDSQGVEHVEDVRGVVRDQVWPVGFVGVTAAEHVDADDAVGFS